jgi:hypothetical protein
VAASEQWGKEKEIQRPSKTWAKTSVAEPPKLEQRFLALEWCASGALLPSPLPKKDQHSLFKLDYGRRKKLVAQLPVGAKDC